MKIIVYSSDIQALRDAQANAGENVVLLRDAGVWCGEVEPCDAVQIMGDFPALEAAYKDVPRFGDSPKEKPVKKTKEA